MGYIYSITNNINKFRFIGITTKSNPYDEWKKYNQIKELNDTPLLKAIDRYGYHFFKFRVLEECNNDIINDKKEEWINKLGTHKEYNTISNNITIQKESKPLVKKTRKRSINKERKIYGYHTITNEYKEWNSQADCAEDIEKNRKKNANINLSLNSPYTNKVACKNWWLFRISDGRKIPLKNIKTASKNRGSSYYSNMGKISAEKCKRRVMAKEKGLSDKVLYFNSISEASFYIKGDYTAVPSIIKNIHETKPWCHAWGYKWSYY